MSDVDHQGPVLGNGRINVRLTNPELFGFVMLTSVVALLQGVDFTLGAAGFVPAPTFYIYNQSNYVWGVGFLAIGLFTLIPTLIWRNDRQMKMGLAVSAVYLAAIMFGTCQPFRDGTGSLQLPILYATWVGLCLRTLLMPLINPWTARRDA